MTQMLLLRTFCQVRCVCCQLMTVLTRRKRSYCAFHQCSESIARIHSLPATLSKFESCTTQQQNMRKFEEEIRKFVKTQLKADGFHHVLTEIAFLKIRRLHYNN